MGGSNPWPRLTRRAFIQSAAAAGLLAACGNPAEVAASPGDGSVDLSSATLASASGQTVYTIPGRIRSDGSREVSQEINDWIASIPNGTAGAYNKAVFVSDGIYWVDDTIEPFSKSYIVFAGNGSTFVRRNQLPGTTNEIRARAHWRFNQCAFFRYNNLHVEGQADPTVGYNSALEAQHAFTHTSSVQALSYYCTANNVWGDAFNFARDFRAPHPLTTASTILRPVLCIASRYQLQLATTSRSAVVTSGPVGAAASTSNRTATPVGNTCSVRGLHLGFAPFELACSSIAGRGRVRPDDEAVYGRLAADGVRDLRPHIHGRWYHSPASQLHDRLVHDGCRAGRSVRCGHVFPQHGRVRDGDEQCSAVATGPYASDACRTVRTCTRQRTRSSRTKGTPLTSDEATVTGVSPFTTCPPMTTHLR